MNVKSDLLYVNYNHTNISIPKGFDIDFYEKTSDEYDSMYKPFMPTDKAARILDIGCGKGFFLYHLAKQGYTNYYGIDADSSSIEHTKKHITELCEHNLAEDFVSLRKDFYDMIIMNEVLEHIPKESIIPLLRIIFESLKMKGTLICYVPNMENPFTSYTRYHDFTHTIGFTQNSLTMVLKTAGFSNIEVYLAENKKKGLKRKIKKMVQLLIRKILHILFEYPPSGILFTSRIFSVAIK